MCWGGGNTEAFLAHKVERWGMDYQPRPDAKTIAPAFVTTRQQLQWLKHPKAREALDYIDPYRYRDRLVGKPILFVFGASDPLFPPTGSRGFTPRMPATVRELIAANTGHTTDTWRHARAWCMWLAHCFADRPMPVIDVGLDPMADGQAQVVATVEAAGELESVRCWSAADPAGAYHEARWQRTDMDRVASAGDTFQETKRGYQCVLPAPSNTITALFVEVLERDVDGVPGIATSAVVEWPEGPWASASPVSPALPASPAEPSADRP